MSRRPTFSAGRIRRVDVADLIVGAADAVGLAAPRLRLSVSGDVDAVAVNAQGLRRVLTNLLENASGMAEVNRSMSRAPGEATSWSSRWPIAVRYPGPHLGELTTKYVSVGGQRGTAGLGLWIVQQIVEAMGGRVDFSARDGGLLATFRAPWADRRSHALAPTGQ